MMWDLYDIGDAPYEYFLCSPPPYKTRDVYKESIKALEADIQHANTLLSGDLTRDLDGAFLQMRMSYSSLAPLLLFLIRWTDCSLAGALGLIRVLIYKVYMDGSSTMSIHERRASLDQFYGFLLPSLQQLQPGVTQSELDQQKRECEDRFCCESDEARFEREFLSDAEREMEGECGICLEQQEGGGRRGEGKVVLPGCGHAMCMKCFMDWNRRSRSCPFCRGGLEDTEAEDLWILMDGSEIYDLSKIMRESLKRFFLYIERLPICISESALFFDSAI